MDRDGCDPEQSPDQAKQGLNAVAGQVEDMVQRQGVLDYVSDISLELAALLEGQHLPGLGHDLRRIAEQVRGAKYQANT